MDFTPPSNPPIQANPISSIPSSRKLPIKRKTPNNNNNNINPNSTSSLILTFPNNNDVTATDTNHPPFKFHRVWSEPDEIRLLQSLLDCSSKGLSFPRDLGIFYNIFSNGMSQPYSKSQLSEKLRRLRKKFRMISSRLANGLDKDSLSGQDRALFDLSKLLWEPEPEPEPKFNYIPDDDDNNNYIDNNNNNNNDNKWKESMAGVEVEAEAEAGSYTMAVLALPSVVKRTGNRDNCSEKINKVDRGNCGGGGMGEDGLFVIKKGGNRDNCSEKYNKVDRGSCDGGGGGLNGNEGGKEVRVERSFGDELSSGIARFARTTVVEVVERSLKEVRRRIEVGNVLNVEKEMSFERRWRDQYVEEFDVLAKRLKLIVEGSSMVGK